MIFLVIDLIQGSGSLTKVKTSATLGNIIESTYVSTNEIHRSRNSDGSLVL